jgi:hypothetical protein
MNLLKLAIATVSMATKRATWRPAKSAAVSRQAKEVIGMNSNASRY